MTSLKRETQQHTAPENECDGTVLDLAAQERLDEIEKKLRQAAIPMLERMRLTAEYVEIAAKSANNGHDVQKRRGRPEGGISLAARKLPIPGRTEAGRRKFAERACTVAHIHLDLTADLAEARMADNRSALTAFARRLGQTDSVTPEAQRAALAVFLTEREKDGGRRKMLTARFSIPHSVNADPSAVRRDLEEVALKHGLQGRFAGNWGAA